MSADIQACAAYEHLCHVHPPGTRPGCRRPAWLPADERGFFLDQYREALENARDPGGWKQLRRVLRLWRFHADAVEDPSYREALDAARGPVSGGMTLEDAVRVYRPAS
jgi:hypothetical protein